MADIFSKQNYLGICTFKDPLISNVLLYARSTKRFPIRVFSTQIASLILVSYQKYYENSHKNIWNNFIFIIQIRIEYLSKMPFRSVYQTFYLIAK